MKENCKNCFYSRMDKKEPGFEEDRLCCRYAPKAHTMNIDYIATWTIVNDNDWCGEWRERLYPLIPIKGKASL